MSTREISETEATAIIDKAFSNKEVHFFKITSGSCWIEDGNLHVEQGVAGDCAGAASHDHQLWVFTPADLRAIMGQAVKVLAGPK